jgi:hypothetical protein
VSVPGTPESERFDQELAGAPETPAAVRLDH